VHVLLSGTIIKSTTGTERVAALADLRRAVHDGLRAKLVLQSVVTGQKSIELNLLPKSPPVTIPEGLPVEIPVIADNFAALEDQLQDLPVAKIAADLLATMASVRTTMAAASAALAAAGTTLTGAGRELGSVGKDAHRTLAAADLALVKMEGTADQALGALTRLADHADGTMTAIQPDLVRTLSASREAAESARTALARVARLTAPEGPLGDDLQGAVTDLAAAARGVRDWSEVVDEQPNAIIFGRRQSGKEPP
jgi:paraquat-inducible protein B